VSVGREQLQALIKDLGEIPRDLQREMRPAFRRAAQPAAARIRQNASWSSRIPAAVKVSTSFGRTPGVMIRVDSTKAPHARPIEHVGRPGTFRHPVYGNREVWRPQQARPFFYRGVEATADQIRDAIGAVITDVASRHGF
jgi:hypothetical protein